MTRAYLRLDPAFDERKEAYPDGPYAALIATFCLAELQPQRGRFRSFDYLVRLLGRRGRHAKYLLEHGDVVTLEDGRVYVDGWDEWQEGDWKVAERVARIRSRKGGTVPVTVDVTVPVTVGVTADRLAIAERSVSNSGAEQLERVDPVDAYYRMLNRFPSESVIEWLDDLTGKYGAEQVVMQLAAAYAEDRTVKTLLGRTGDRLASNARRLSAKEREDEAREASRRRRERTQTYLRELRGESA